MRRSDLLLFDAIGNLLLGILLLATPVRLASWLGLSDIGNGFYPSVFGAVLFGVGISLMIERFGPAHGSRGLGLLGALSINLRFGLALAGWLVFGHLSLPTHGLVILWALAGILVLLSGAELTAEIHSEKATR